MNVTGAAHSPAQASTTHRYEAVVRISEAISASRDPEELAKTLADQLIHLKNFRYPQIKLRLVSVIELQLSTRCCPRESCR